MSSYTSSLRVLVVDDDPLLRWAVSETLRAQGHEAVEAATAREAVVAASRTPPDVILLDYHLPDSRTFELLSTLQRVAPTVAVVMMSAYADDPRFVAHALRTGATTVLDKPLDLSHIPGVVDHANRCRPL
jgi:DNA-binding NtrC family response regulator